MIITFNKDVKFDLNIKIVNEDDKNNHKKFFIDENNNLKLIYNIKNKTSQLDLEKTGWDILDYLKSNNFENVNLYVDDNIENCNDMIFSIIIGIELSNYKFDKYFSDDKKEKCELKTKILNINIENYHDFDNKYKEFQLLRDNIFFCRDIVNEPSNVINPETYAEVCKNLEKIGVKVNILNRKNLEKLGMNAVLAVGQGSSIDPKVIVMSWNGDSNKKQPIALVGKGVTFDSGGLSLKPESAMYDMKCDMAGSAVVVSSIKLLAERKAKVNAVGIIGLVENMPSGNAVKPGDIITSMSGQTIEILNTDAEGRVVLADLLYYASKEFKPSIIIDFATLTAAICVALGECYAGVFTNNDELANMIIKSSENANEPIWRMPLGKIGSDYDILMDSKVADIKNVSGTKYSGAATAAQFLQRFLNGNVNWAHIDIAGTAFVERKGFFVNKDATGFGVRLINDLIKNNYES